MKMLKNLLLGSALSGLSTLVLAAGNPLEPLLRSFEWRLLDDLGYGFALDSDIHGAPIAADGLYRLQVDAGLEQVFLLQPGLFNGTELLAMAEADWSAPGALSAAKRLMRQALAVQCGATLLLGAVLGGVARLTMSYLDAPNIVMMFLLGVVLIAVRYGRGPAVFAAILYVGIFDFFY